MSRPTQYAAPDAIAPNANDDLSTNYGYTSFLGLSSVDTPDTSASMTYDVVGRPATATSPYGAVTYYTYSSTNVNLIVTTTDSRIVKTTLDGLGRTIVSVR